MSHVADTHALLWYAAEDPKLGTRARQLFEEAEEGKRRIFIPSIILGEALYALRKERRMDRFEPLLEFIESMPSFPVVPLDLAIIRRCGWMSDPPEFHDRVITATALLQGAKVITKDPAIRAMCAWDW